MDKLTDPVFGHVIEDVFYLLPVSFISRLFTAVAGEFGVRRSKGKGKQFDIKTSPHFARSFICLDEYNKLTGRDTKRNVLYFLDGTLYRFFREVWH